MAGHVMQLQTIFDLKLKDFKVMVGLETTLHLYNIYKCGEVCTDPSLNPLEKLGILRKGLL